MRQPATRLRLTFSLPEGTSLDELETWITDALESDVRQYHPIFLGYKPGRSAEEKYLRYLLHVATILLQDISVPVFERAAVSGINKNLESEGQFIADVWFPVVHDFPLDVFHTWLRLAGELINNSLKVLNNVKSRESAYQAFQQNHVMPWSRKVPGGRSTIPLLEAAFELGIPFAHLAAGKYLLGWGRQSRIFYKSSSSLDSAIGASATHNKDVALRIMRRSGVPVPKGSTFASGETIDLASVANLRLPLVVKPVDRDRGEGVTMNIASHDALQSAVRKAAELSRAVLVEEQIEGTCHRILVVSGRVVYAVKRNPRSITGDGINTIETLVELENASIRRKVPQKRLPELRIDDEALRFLEKMGLRKESVLSLGMKTPLRPAQSTQWGGSPQELTQALHPENAELCIRVAKLFSLECAGVDFISTDISIPWHQNGAAINEVNFTPVIGRTHSFQRDAARAYLKQLFPSAGKIPVDFYIGERAYRRAIDKWHHEVAHGNGCFFCNDKGVFKPDGHLLQVADTRTVFDRVTMLRTNTDVESLVVHTNDESLFLTSGFPVEYGFIHKE